MEHKIVFATSNAGKMREIREILKDPGAEITMDEKNAISHRGKALRAMKKRLAEEIGE